MSRSRQALAAPLALLFATLLISGASAAPVATSDQSYTVLGRVFPDPQGGCKVSAGPCSPRAEGNTPATSFISYNDFVAGMSYMNTRETWQRYVEVWPMDGKLGPGGGTDERTAFPGNNLGEFHFKPDPSFHSSGLPTSTQARQISDLFLVRVTDETVPDAGKKRMVVNMSIHGIERAGVEGGTRAMEDLVTAATSPSRTGGKSRLDDPILATKGLSVPVPTFREVLRNTVIYFLYPNPDGWRRGSLDEGGTFFQRYNGNGVDVNRDFPDIGYSFRSYSALSENESRAIHSVLLQLKHNEGLFAAGDDLHGQLGADSFSFTLLPHGRHDFQKNGHIVTAVRTINLVQQDALSWSPLIQSNNAPPGRCVNGALSPDCVPMYGQNWGSVYDTINYTVTGAIGDWLDSSIGLGAEGIDNEMSYSHLDKDVAFDPEIEQLHVDGNATLVYAHLSEILADQPRAVVPARGRKGYVPETREVRAARANKRLTAPPGTAPQPAIDGTANVDPATNSATFTWTVKRDEKTYDGGMRVDATRPNAQGIDPSEGANAASQNVDMTVQCKGCDEHPGVKDKDEWVTVAEDYTQSPIYLQAGVTVAINQPQPFGKDGKPVQWRAIVTHPVGAQVVFHLEFTSGPATTDGETGGGLPPRLAAYDVASTDFWRDLNRYSPPGNGFETIDARRLATSPKAKLPDLDTLVLTDDALPGYHYPRTAEAAPPPPVQFTSKSKTQPCASADGNPDPPTCYEDVPFKITGPVKTAVVSVQPTAGGDLTLKILDSKGNQLGFSDGGGAGQSESVTLSKPAAGDYTARVGNYLAPDSSFKGGVSFPVEPPPPGASAYTDPQYARYAGKVKEWVQGGGNLVLTDGAMRMLPDLFGQIPREAVSKATSYVGQVAFAKDPTTSKSPDTPGNTLGDPLAKGVKLQGARFNTGLRRQTFEPTPIGFSIQNALTGANESHAPVWQVDRKAFEAAGGRLAATSISGAVGAADVTDQVTLGELKLGNGVVRILGALLPQPSEAYDHQEGLEPYGVTYTGYQLATNLVDWCKPGRVNCGAVLARALRDRLPPRSHFARHRVRATRRGITLSGTSRDYAPKGVTPKLAHVYVAILYSSHGRCRSLDRRGHYGRLSKCVRTRYMLAKGTKHWRFALRARLRPGRYFAWVRGVDVSGNVERKLRGGNHIVFRIR